MVAELRMSLNPPVVARIPIPVGWFDKTMTVYAAPIERGDPMAANIVVSRDALGLDEDFPGYAERQAKTFAASLPGCAVLCREKGDFGKRHAERLELQWNSAAGRIHQLVVFIAAGDGVVVSFAASASVKSFEKHRPQFDDTLSRLKITAARS
jgi:hypothetical protein